MSLDYHLIMTYTVAILLFLGTPGPVTLLVVNSSTNGGFRAGLATVIGTNLASIILIALSFIFIRGFIVVSQTALPWLTLVGSFYILYFSLKIITSKIPLLEKQALNTKSCFNNGFMIGISNPKDILFLLHFFRLFCGFK